VASSSELGEALPERGLIRRKPGSDGQGSGTYDPPNEPFGPWRRPVTVPIFRSMSERGLHQIEDDLSETWLEDWAGAGVLEIEALLAKHAAFLSFLESQEA
jgi:hypothetical protein